MSLLRQITKLQHFNIMSKSIYKTSQYSIRNKRFVHNNLQNDTSQVIKPSRRIIAFDNDSICYNTDLKSSMKNDYDRIQINKLKTINDKANNTFLQISCDNEEFETVLPHKRI